MIAAADKHRERMAEISRERSRQAAEIGDIPPVKNRRRRKRAENSLLYFLKTYFPHSTGLKPFSEDHKRGIQRIENCIRRGGYYLQIVYRGWAKSTITENSAIWAALFGLRRFIVPIGADVNSAKSMLDSIQMELETNDLLLEDFPEVCFPVRALEGKAQRCATQLHHGKLTYIEWNADYVALPMIPGSISAGVAIKPVGITANMRGLRHKRPDGTQIRPDFLPLDDIQTDESAASPSQCEKTLRMLNKTIMRLAGHNKSPAIVINATVIEPDDAIDQLSDAKRYPSWQTERIPMVKKFPAAHETMWLEEYASIRNAFNPEDPDSQAQAKSEATKFYRKNREAMDAGAEVSWRYCYDEKEEISALQHAYNIMIDSGEDAFMSECQNQPQRPSDDLNLMTTAEIAKKVSAYPRLKFPAACSTLVAFVDVHPDVLYWRLWAFAQGFTGYMIDGGTFPDQKKTYFDHRSIRYRLSKVFPGRNVSSQIYAGLEKLTNDILGRSYSREDGAIMHVSRCLVDANGEESDTIKAFCTESRYRGILTPSYGKGIGASQTPISRWQQSRGGRFGPEWVPTQGKKGQVIGVIFDTNYWKRKYHEGLRSPRGNSGCLEWFNAPQLDHQLAADHTVAELPKKVTHGGREVYEFKLQPGKDNHIFDCDVGCMVAASIAGISHLGSVSTQKKKKPVKSRRL